MSRPGCDRSEPERLARWDDRAPPDAHERGCDECQQARARYDRIAEMFVKLPVLAPPAGWEERVLARVDAPAAPARRLPARWTWALAATLLLVAAVVIVRRPPEERLALHQEVIPAASGRRADSAVVGDRLGLRASPGGAAHAELRVYRGERELVLRCPGDHRCRAAGGMIEADLTLTSRGSYRALVLAAEAPLAAPAGSLDEDARAARALGGRVEVGPAVDVE
ncbi:hypothetical protein WMF18_15700 [Sorangium sp. So ce315]|uniref:hypothetical protein n=1 Tax=Sorangium sp. So ce315 TaxID=3133299 RepID=UPI003F640CAC